jgi:hypothetical protein
LGNTISTKTYRDKYRLANLDTLLRAALVAEKICDVDRSGSKTIQNPYGSQPTTVVQAIAGTYTPATYTTTDDTLTVADEFIVSEQVYDFEKTLTNFDLFANRTDEQAYSIATAIDKQVVNALALGGTGAYTTPVGGFTTIANVNVIMANLIAKTVGYADTYKGLFLVLEPTDIVGLIQVQAANGFSFADSVLNNGWMTSYMGVDIYVVKAGTFVSATIGTLTFVNSGCRLFGVKNVTTYAAPQGVMFDEKGVTGKTGKEVVTYGYLGVKVWAVKAALIVKITLA